MKTKKQAIIESALSLFAKEGYNATSTNKVASLAKVSEGLIFKHFTNKEGLLKGIFEAGKGRFNEMIVSIIEEEIPKKVIAKTISLPFDVSKDEFDFWKLQFKLKWELDYDGTEKVEPLFNKLIWAFEELNNKNPNLEAELIIHFLEGVSTAIIRGNIDNAAKLKEFMLEKYS